ncbi:MAG: hypothetical protein ACJAT2_002462 [Bacteriovoracaceae bacterium]|jgi:hypothetical protein
MKFLLFCLIISQPIYALELYSIKIPREVVEAMDLSEDLQRRLSGGDIIGNGGGIAEQDFRFAYRKIPSIVDSCLESPFCPIPNKEIELLKNIKKIAVSSAPNKDRLIFLSESDYPGFFKDSNDSKIRIAKTANIKGAPVFVNLDMLYGGKNALLDFPAIVSVLVHEIGHQASIKSHSLLDELGTRLREFLLDDASSIEQEVGGARLRLSYYNLKEANRFAEFMLHYKDDFFSLKSSLIEKISCEEGALPIGFKVSNLHWNRRVDVYRGVFMVPLKAWLHIFCLDLDSSAIWIKETDATVELLFLNSQGESQLESYKVIVSPMKLDPSPPLP